jgi:Domain of unknown function (DUF5666)
MKFKLLYFGLYLMLASLFTGCHSSSSDNNTAPSAVKSQVTTGVITGFGSVFVNGVEFSKKADVTDAQAVTFSFDDSHPGQAGLKIGMIVTVKGTADTATKKGEFESIEFKPELRGPATNAVVSGTTGTLTILGHEVVTTATTSIEGAADLAALQSKLTGANAGKHPEIEVSGRMDNAGVFHATRIAVKADDFTAGGKCAIHGKIASAATSTTGGQRFLIGNIEVVTTATTSMPNLTTADLIAGASVEVKGTFDVNTNTLTATRIEGNKGNHGLGEGVEVEDTVSIQGIAAGALSGGSFALNGPNGAVTVNCNNATVFSGGAADSSIIAANATLEVEGTVQADGSVLALKIKSETEIESEGHSGGGGGGETESGGGGGGK